MIKSSQHFKAEILFWQDQFLLLFKDIVIKYVMASLQKASFKLFEGYSSLTRVQDLEPGEGGEDKVLTGYHPKVLTIFVLPWWCRECWQTEHGNKRRGQGDCIFTNRTVWGRAKLVIEFVNCGVAVVEWEVIWVDV